MRFAVFLISVGLFMCSWLAASADAAEINRSKLPGCAIRIDGPIELHDGAKFTAIADSLALIDGKTDGEVWNGSSEAVCLNSPGGSWLEGRIIAEMVFLYGITTRISAGDECLSACSIIFMAGRVRGDEFDGPSRYLNARGHLGFHGPYLVSSPDQTYSSEEMRAVSVQQNRIISDFIRFGSNGYANSYRPTILMSLVGQLLSFGPSEMLYVETIEQIVRWDIRLEGINTGVQLDKRRVFQACENALTLPFDKPSRDIKSVDYQYEPDVSYKSYNVFGEEKTYATVQFSGDANRICNISLTDDKKIRNKFVESLTICTDDGNTGVSVGSCPEFGIYYPAYLALPPSTPISTLAIDSP